MLIARCVGSAFLFVAGLAMFVWMNKDKKNFRFNIDEVHHAYYGWAILWISPLHTRILPLWVYVSLLFIGAYLFIDDVFQHNMQVLYPDYQSPVHRLLRFFRFVW